MIENIGYEGVKSHYYDFMSKEERRVFLDYIEKVLNIKRNTFLVKLSGRNEFTTAELICLTNVIQENLWRTMNLLPAPTEELPPETAKQQK